MPNQKVLQDAGVEEEIKKGIRLVQEVTEFSEKRLGLRSDGSYDTFFLVKGEALIYLVSACPQDSFAPFTWRFPVVGEMDYKGFFNKKDAVKEINKLETREYDTCLQHAIAFSTLGWLRDPIYSTVLDHHPVIVINIIIHELVHNTVFFKGETEFNEQLASFIAEQGTLLFINERFGRSSPFYRLALDLAQDEELIAGFFEELHNTLQELYDAQDLSRDEKISKREEIFARGERRLVEISKELKTGGFSIPKGGLNNAVVLAYRRYRVPADGLIVKAYEALGEDTAGLIDLLKTVRKSKEKPSRFLDRWLQERFSSPLG